MRMLRGLPRWCRLPSSDVYPQNSLLMPCLEAPRPVTRTAKERFRGDTSDKTAEFVRGTTRSGSSVLECVGPIDHRDCMGTERVSSTSTSDTPVPTLYVMVGLPAVGKTHRAKQIEASVGALRLTKDEWMLPLFGNLEDENQRDVLEGRLVWLALRALRLGTSVVLDFGVWSRVERSALRHLARGAERSAN